MNKSPRKALIRTSFFLFSVLLTILSPIYLTANAKAQYAVTYNGWTTIKMSDKVEFQIPPTMEIQSDKYRSLSPTLEKTLNPYNLPRIVAQQKGLNRLAPYAFSQYVRAVFKIVPTLELLPKWGEKIEVTAEDLAEIERQYLPHPEDGNIKLIGVSQHAKIISMNGGQYINIKYETQYNNNPIVYNDFYMTFNGYEIYVFLTMIRSTEVGYWTDSANDVRNIVRTIRILR